MKEQTSNNLIDPRVGFGEAGDQSERDSKYVGRKAGHTIHSPGHFDAGIQLPPESEKSDKRVLPLKVPVKKGQEPYSK